jgi:hypothetical protein
VNSTVLKLTGPVRRIEEPVVILAVNDTVRQRNYYHWINFILTRCVFCSSKDGCRIAIADAS